MPDPGLPPPGGGGPKLVKRRYNKARSAEGDDRQWENDKPSWDTDARCTDCGEKEEGYVVDITNDADIMTETDIIPDGE